MRIMRAFGLMVASSVVFAAGIAAAVIAISLWSGILAGTAALTAGAIAFTGWTYWAAGKIA